MFYDTFFDFCAPDQIVVLLTAPSQHHSCQKYCPIEQGEWHFVRELTNVLQHDTAVSDLPVLFQVANSLHVDVA